MSPLTRRDFLSDAAMAGAASALRLDAASSTNHEGPPERRANFDRDWRFLFGDPEGAQTPTFHDAVWRSLDLPHDWSIEGSFDENAPAKGNGAYLPTGIGWYRKNFIVPSSAHGRRIALQFDGVYQRSEVWINGIPLGMQGNCIWNFVEPAVPLPVIGGGVRFWQEGSSHVLRRNFGTVFRMLGGAGRPA